MRKHPRLITGLVIFGMLFAFTIPVALAFGKPDHVPCPPNNKHCEDFEDWDRGGNHDDDDDDDDGDHDDDDGDDDDDTTTYPPGTTTTTTDDDDDDDDDDRNVCKDGTGPPCGNAFGHDDSKDNCRDGSSPPCGNAFGHGDDDSDDRSANLGQPGGISAGAVLAGLGVVVLGYLGVQRRRTLKLDKE